MCRLGSNGSLINKYEGNMMIYLLILIFYVYLILRNNKVLDLRQKITNGCYNYLSYYLSQFKDDKDFIEHIDEYNKEYSRMKEIIDRYSYPRMLFDFRPLTLNAWFEEDEVNLIEKYENYK